LEFLPPKTKGQLRLVIVVLA